MASCKDRSHRRSGRNVEAGGKSKARGKTLFNGGEKKKKRVITIFR